MENMITLTIDGIEVQAPQGSTVLEAARLAGIRIPTLCFLKDINEIGACRMCVVDSGARSLQAACVLPATDGMKVKTNTPQIRAYRKNMLELILSTHDKKCLTCIRSQNCELQALCKELGVEDGDMQGKPVPLEWTDTSGELLEWWHDPGVPLAFPVESASS